MCVGDRVHGVGDRVHSVGERVHSVGGTCPRVGNVGLACVGLQAIRARYDDSACATSRSAWVAAGIAWAGSDGPVLGRMLLVGLPEPSVAIDWKRGAEPNDRRAPASPQRAQWRALGASVAAGRARGLPGRAAIPSRRGAPLVHG